MLTQLPLPQQIVIALALLMAFVIAIYASNLWILTLISLRARKKVASASEPKSWPKVSIHLPVYNEKRVISRLLDSCVALDYPQSKIEILVIDDSTDETTAVAKSYERRYPGLVKVIHRVSRDGFKAGALQEALRNSTGEFFAIFDADYIPPKDFLKKTMPYFNCAKTAFVQTRSGYLNDRVSWVTEAQSLAIDVYGFVDQRARSSANLLAHFCGTGGIFRREAVESVGGWTSDTMAEDLDLSVRLQLAGWKYVYLPHVVCRGEIPPSFSILRHQQFRWAKGFTECLRKHWQPILKNRRLSLFQKAEAMVHLGTYLICPATILVSCIGVSYYLVFPLSFLMGEYWHHWIALLILALSLPAYTAPLAASSVTLYMLKGREKGKLRRILHLFYLGILLYGLLLSNTVAVAQGLLTRRSDFRRTPKLGIVNETAST